MDLPPLALALHRYQRTVWHLAHPPHTPEAVARWHAETAAALDQVFRLHCGPHASADQLAWFPFVKQVVLQALLPPVVEPLLARVAALEQAHQELGRLLQELVRAVAPPSATSTLPAPEP